MASRYEAASPRTASNGSYGRALITELGAITDLRIPRRRLEPYRPSSLARAARRSSAVDRVLRRAFLRGPLGESPFTRPHRVREVVGNLDPFERQWQRRWVEEVGDDDRRLREPGGDGLRVATHQYEFCPRAASSGTSRPPM